MQTYTRSVTYKGVTKTVTLHVCGAEEYAAIYHAHGVVVWYDNIVLPRGFAIDNEVWVKSLAVVPHELGHVFGLGHTPLPTTMNFTGLLRWFDVEGLKPAAAQLMGDSA